MPDAPRTDPGVRRVGRQRVASWVLFQRPPSELIVTLSMSMCLRCSSTWSSPSVSCRPASFQRSRTLAVSRRPHPPTPAWARAATGGGRRWVRAERSTEACFSTRPVENRACDLHRTRLNTCWSLRLRSLFPDIPPVHSPGFAFGYLSYWESQPAVGLPHVRGFPTRRVLRPHRHSLGSRRFAMGLPATTVPESRFMAHSSAWFDGGVRLALSMPPRSQGARRGPARLRQSA